MFDYRLEADRWLDYERDRQRRTRAFPKKFIGARSYPHFDSTISLNHDHEGIARLQESLSKSRSISKWPFFPFIRTDQRNRRYRNKPKADDDALAGPISRNQKKYTHIKNRPIMYASHRDACVFSYFGYLLNPYYEAELATQGLEDCVVAYRSIDHKNNVDFAQTAFLFMEANDGWACILLDIKDFFGSIDHDRLRRSLSKLLGHNLPLEIEHILGALTKYRYVIKDEVVKTLRKHHRPYNIGPQLRPKKLCKIEDFNKLINPYLIRVNRKGRGIPQGSPVSGLLANIFLLEFDKRVKQLLGKSQLGLYQRYSDDILIVCPVGQVEAVYSEVRQMIREYGVQISAPKTEAFEKKHGELINITGQLEKGKPSKRQQIQYLGIEWNGRQIVLRPNTIAKRYRPKNNRAAKKFWGYHRLAIVKTQSQALQIQFNRVRRTIKLMAKKKSEK